MREDRGDDGRVDGDESRWTTVDGLVYDFLALVVSNIRDSLNGRGCRGKV